MIDIRLETCVPSVALRIVTQCLGKNPKGFPTQRAALEGKDQLRWAGGFPSHVSLLLLLCDPLVQVVCVNLFAIFMCDDVLRHWSVVRFGLVARFALRAVVLLHANCFWERWEGEFLLEDGRWKGQR